MRFDNSLPRHGQQCPGRVFLSSSVRQCHPAVNNASPNVLRNTHEDDQVLCPSNEMNSMQNATARTSLYSSPSINDQRRSSDPDYYGSQSTSYSAIGYSYHVAKHHHNFHADRRLDHHVERFRDYKVASQKSHGRHSQNASTDWDMNDRGSYNEQNMASVDEGGNSSDTYLHCNKSKTDCSDSDSHHNTNSHSYHKKRRHSPFRSGTGRQYTHNLQRTIKHGCNRERTRNSYKAKKRAERSHHQQGENSTGAEEVNEWKVFWTKFFASSTASVLGVAHSSATCELAGGAGPSVGVEVTHSLSSARNQQPGHKTRCDTQRHDHLAPASVTNKALTRLPAQPCQSVSRLLLHGYQRGEVTRTKLHRTLMLSTARCLQQTDLCSLSTLPHDSLISQDMDQMTFMELNRDHDRLLCMWSVSGTNLQQVQVVRVQERVRTQCGELAVEFVPSDFVLQSWSNISSLCWVDCPWLNDNNHVLYLTHDRSSPTVTVAYIRTLDPASDSSVNANFVVGEKMSWTCAWNKKQEKFSVGMHRGSKVIDVNTRQFHDLSTRSADVITQVFSQEDGGNTLYSGTRKGSVLMHDMRSDNRVPVELFRQTTSVCSLKLSSDERSIYFSDSAGRIKKWDLRMRRTMVRYEGLYNQCRWLPIHIDHTHSLLYAAGMDCVTKIWCLESGQLIRSLPPPYEASPFAIPTLQFSSQWAGVPGNMGLIMGGQKNFHLYSSGV